MNGAERLIQTLLDAGIDTCFANPGTSEMHLVAALDRLPGMHCVLALFEGVATGAADGYARMAGKPAVTLLHLGPGLGNGLANLHNAKKARSPMINIVGDHATWHRQYDAPLTADVEGVAAPMSDWVHTCTGADRVSADTRAAIAASKSGAGGIATLIMPADCAWSEASDDPTSLQNSPTAASVPADRIAAAAEILMGGGNSAFLIGGSALCEPGLSIAARIAACTGARLMGPTSDARAERGAGRPIVTRLPYPVDQAIALTASIETVVLCGASDPVAFFAYPDKPSLILPDACKRFALATRDDDLTAILRALEIAVDAQDAKFPLQSRAPTEAPSGALTLDGLGRSLAALIPENSILVDEAISSGFVLLPLLRGAAAHDHLQLTGGAIGSGLPMALGAAIAAPDRKTVCLQADGSGMYTLQALWSMAREKTDVVVVILANRSYGTLHGELRNVGVNTAGPNALAMMDLSDPIINWVPMAEAMGVFGERCTDLDSFNKAFTQAMARPGPYLIEAVLQVS